jgi:hypothetical protein
MDPYDLSNPAVLNSNIIRNRNTYNLWVNSSHTKCLILAFAENIRKQSWGAVNAAWPSLRKHSEVMGSRYIAYQLPELTQQEPPLSLGWPLTLLS